MASAGAINAVANVVLIRQFQERSQGGALGAAWALVITEVAVMIAGLLVIRAVLSFLPSSLIRTSTLRRRCRSTPTT